MSRWYVNQFIWSCLIGFVVTPFLMVTKVYIDELRTVQELLLIRTWRLTGDRFLNGRGWVNFITDQVPFFFRVVPWHSKTPISYSSSFLLMNIFEHTVILVKYRKRLYTCSNFLFVQRIPRIPQVLFVTVVFQQNFCTYIQRIFRWYFV